MRCRVTWEECKYIQNKINTPPNFSFILTVFFLSFPLNQFRHIKLQIDRENCDPPPVSIWLSISDFFLNFYFHFLFFISNWKLGHRRLKWTATARPPFPKSSMSSIPRSDSIVVFVEFSFFFSFLIVLDICCEPKCNFHWLIKNKSLQLILVLLKPHNSYMVWKALLIAIAACTTNHMKNCNIWETPQNILKGAWKISLNFCIMQLTKSYANVYWFDDSSNI